MSRVGAMVDYALKRVEAAVPTANKLKVEIPAQQIDEGDLPACMPLGVVRDTSQLEFRQTQEATAISLAYVDKFQPGEDPFRALLDVHEAIEDEIRDSNALDTDDAGFFAYVSAFGVEMSSNAAARGILVLEVTFDTMDAADSAFALEEDPT